ncbi:MAG: cupin domain-containing protein [Proteobacteria bacterium]|nr:cupin domain-containing protein [Pseudomonadota bacterium]MBU4356440.1 cupin domain-containing protein [Pseudomonadota bacterium]MBU4447003.1 cupin domain-containing protein [Pseudomonadota bacterium]
MAVANLFDPIPPEITAEIIQVLLSTGIFRLERIVSAGQATPPGEWYDQDTHEWVALLSGGAGLRFEDEAEPRVLSPGDYLLIPAHRRHRVEWTDPETPTVWLALHYPENRGQLSAISFQPKD